MTSSAIDPTQLQPGMEVVGTDGDHVGRIAEVREDRILVQRADLPSLAVPFAFVRYTSGNRVVLTIATSRADQMGWESPIG